MHLIVCMTCRMPPQAEAVQPPCGSDYSLQKDGTRREDGKAVKGAVDDFARRKGRRPPVRKGRLAGATGLLHWPSFGRLALGGATHSLVEHPSSAHSPVVAVGVIAELAPHSTRPRLSTAQAPAADRSP